MSAYLACLDRAVQDLEQQAAALKAAGREDEAVFCRIQINIHEICRTLYHVCRRTCGGGDLKALYLQKLDRLAPSWESSRAQALAYGDDCKAVIEGLKLDTLARNRIHFLELDQKTE